MVVTGIIVIVTSVILANNSRFGGIVQLENLTYDVALTVRQAQVYGISVQRYGASNFSSGYGMHFDSNDPQHYELFADADEDGYDVSENVPPSPYTIRSGYRIHKLCVPQGNDAVSCDPVSQVDIIFHRPEPDATIHINGDSAINDSARIVLISPRGDIMSVVVENSGQISVRRPGQ
ncbi:hypothetical protein A2763_03665 [Candidatus Kaiserbacteria bacterium RIFCSPHIGHO2_01_FULL_54_36]|uniref:General secretion pathway GspH domain-containing protein n=1 Tax=Candidatus Kaiserbacteria bacterium RIFCSPHIGHO2_01_FULL_54_36 TaxID=1798482 RepID=A0A1F6CN93_9BACT|nr:MAG: hypothetical protein A2763_03665 [Candidatus Kaiserbacteria bacterium RIFCSPHIGHO2_01_FULL_54_36]OGG75961.1 MAG: hypothetical protein A3A41_01760 [Candidatus Kaiserbacteria bacterium RIFCSPLOWO2_01_FULL_54_22]